MILPNSAGLPEPMTQSEQEGSSSVLTRLLAMTADYIAHTLVSQPYVHVTLQQAVS